MFFFEWQQGNCGLTLHGLNSFCLFDSCTFFPDGLLCEVSLGHTHLMHSLTLTLRLPLLHLLTLVDGAPQSPQHLFTATSSTASISSPSIHSLPSSSSKQTRTNNQFATSVRAIKLPCLLFMLTPEFFLNPVQLLHRLERSTSLNPSHTDVN